MNLSAKPVRFWSVMPWRWSGNTSGQTSRFDQRLTRRHRKSRETGGKDYDHQDRPQDSRSPRKKGPESSGRSHEGCGPCNGDINKVGKTRLKSLELGKDRKGLRVKAEWAFGVNSKVQRPTRKEAKSMKRYCMPHFRQGPKSLLEHPNNTIHLANISKEKDKETLTQSTN